MLGTMDPQLAPVISSFVIRFVVDPAPRETPGSPPAYRGAIRHVQSDEEIHFDNWAEAVAFIRRFVPLEAGAGGEPG